MGVWRPDSASRTRIRQAIVDRPDRWRRARNDRKFRSIFELEGGSLKSSPRDFSADHPLIQDLKRTDFLGLCELTEQDILEEGFLDRAATSFAAGRPFMRFLCEALNVPF
jgi:uncharacterized protein (TIGR02453 family)